MGRVRGIWAVGSNQHRKVPQPPAPTPDARMVEVTAAHAFAVESDPFVPLPRNTLGESSTRTARRTLMRDDTGIIPNPLAAPADDVAAYEDSDAYGYVGFCGFDPDETVDMSPHDLVANQTEVDEDLIDLFIEDAPDDPIMVLKVRGSHWIFDGNHRAVAALRAGRTVRAQVMWLDD